jgi:hypothetical protein
MVMEEQARRLAQPLRWGRREKTVMAVFLSCVVIALVALTAYGLSSGGTARKDCVQVTFASTLGGAELHGCGARARQICASGHQFHQIAAELQAACRRAGFPFG